MDRVDVYKLIDGERDYQDRKWTDMQTGAHIHTPEEWVLYMEWYLGEARRILSTKGIPECYSEAMDFVRKVTALGVAAMEQNETKPRM